MEMRGREERRRGGKRGEPRLGVPLCCTRDCVCFSRSLFVQCLQAYSAVESGGIGRSVGGIRGRCRGVREARRVEGTGEWGLRVPQGREVGVLFPVRLRDKGTQQGRVGMRPNAFRAAISAHATFPPNNPAAAARVRR